MMKFSILKNQIRNATQSPAVAVALWIGLFFVFSTGSGSLISGRWAMWVSGMACSLSAVALLWRLSGWILALGKRSGWILATGFGACAIMDIGINRIFLATGPASAPVFLALDLSLMGMALALGMVVAKGVMEKSHILPLAIAAAMVDIWSATRGITHEVIQSPVATNFLFLVYPVPGIGIRPLIGVADLVFTVLFATLARRFCLPLKRTGAVMAGGFALAVTLSALSGCPIPVLPLLGAGFVLAHYGQIKPGVPKETLEAAAGLVVIAAVLLGLTWIQV